MDFKTFISGNCLLILHAFLLHEFFLPSSIPHSFSEYVAVNVLIKKYLSKQQIDKAHKEKEIYKYYNYTLLIIKDLIFK